MRSQRSRGRSALAVTFLVATACSSSAAGAPSLAPAPRGSVLPTAVAAQQAPPPLGACDIGTAGGPDAVVETVRTSDGACLSPTKVVLYRCDPSFDPIIAFGIDGRPRRFLGGAYAVPVATLPDDATPLGIASVGGLFVTPDGRRLYVEAGGVTERWLSLPNGTTIDRPPTATMIGDSILDGGQDAIVTGMPDWSVSIDAEIGRSSGGGAFVAESLSPPMPDVVLVELGVNDVSREVFAENASRILAAVGGADLVVWVTAHGPETVIPEVNREIVDRLGAIPNGAVIDWDRLVPPEDLSSDGVHPTTGQEGLLASFVTPFLESWLLASTGRGAARCEPTIAASVPR